MKFWIFQKKTDFRSEFREIQVFKIADKICE